MNLDRILSVFHKHKVRCLLIGGMNFLLRHKPVLTFDADFWIEDTPGNLSRCETALSALDAEWGPSVDDWGPVSDKAKGWLARQSVFCLISPHGAIDIFRTVQGLDSWAASNANACDGLTAAGTPYRGLSDRDMLKCQLALEKKHQKIDRIRDLRKAINGHG